MWSVFVELAEHHWYLGSGAVGDCLSSGRVSVGGFQVPGHELTLHKEPDPILTWTCTTPLGGAHVFQVGAGG
jgi:hypothetical protein